MAAGAQRRPSIAGAGQVVQRVEDAREALSPLALMERAIREAAQDAGAPKLVESLDAIYVPQGLWKYGDPGRLLAEQLGATDVRTMVGAVSGHIVQLLVNRACQEIAAGRADLIAIVGGESENSKRRLSRREIPLHWEEQIPGEPDARAGDVKFLRTEDEAAAGIMNATSIFSLCDVSLRHSKGETPTEHRDRISQLYARMARVAADNPYAWLREAPSAEQIRNPGPDNRMVNYPYTKLMTSNISVDQAAALILCSEEAAARFEIPTEECVYPIASTEMSHTVLLSERDVLHRHPGQNLAAERLLERSERTPEDLDYVDVYSCFPFAVQAGASALGIGMEPVPSLTGGMTFFGGPFGNYVLHSIASLVERLRADPGSTGAIGSVGGSFAHFAYGLYSTQPGPQQRPIIEDVSAEFAALPRRGYVAEGFAGSARVESYSVVVLHDGPYQATFAALDDAGRRVWGRSHDRTLMEALLDDEEACGRRVRIANGIADLD